MKRMNMIAVLDPAGTLILYTGTVLVSKVHVATVINPNACQPVSVAKRKSQDTSFPRQVQNSNLSLLDIFTLSIIVFP